MKILCLSRSGAQVTVSLPKLNERQLASLRAAIIAPPAASSSELLFELPRSFSNGQRGFARLAVGVGVVVASLAAMVAFVAPSAASVLLGAVVVPALLVAGGAALLGYRRDIGLSVRADGGLRREGWDGITELDLTRYASVSLSE